MTQHYKTANFVHIKEEKVGLIIVYWDRWIPLTVAAFVISFIGNPADVGCLRYKQIGL